MLFRTEVAGLASVWTRNLPDGGDRAKAEAQMLQTLGRAAEVPEAQLPRCLAILREIVQIFD